jgi:LuxR family quorum sensing-dependent transcriptional regulator
MNACTRDVFDWIDNLRTITTAEGAWASFMAFCAQRGFATGALADMPGLEESLGETVVCSDWPDGWLDRYIEADHLRADPTVAAMMFTLEPYTWMEALRFADYGQRAQRVFDEAATFGMHDGFVVPY